MNLPDIEIKFSSILMTEALTLVDARIYLVEDGGLDSWGGQLYNITLLQSFNHVIFPAGFTAAQLQAAFWQRLVLYGTDNYPAFKASQMACTLGL